MVSKVDIKQRSNSVIEAICYWLGYQFKIGRDQFIHEASLRYPIADTFTAKKIAINQIVLEKLHPIFKSKQIDLVIYHEQVLEPEIEEDDSNLKEVFEFKLAKSDTNIQFSEEHQRVFDDVVWLAYYHLWGDKDCYFLMCGKYSDFKNYFLGQSNNVITDELGKVIVPVTQISNKESQQSGVIEWEPKGLYKDWFGFGIDEEKQY